MELFIQIQTIFHQERFVLPQLPISVPCPGAELGHCPSSLGTLLAVPKAAEAEGELQSLFAERVCVNFWKTT